MKLLHSRGFANCGCRVRHVVLLLSSLLFGALAVWISPDRLSAIGIMDFSLASKIDLVRETALLEIRIAKYGAAAMALFLFTLWLAMPGLVRTEWYKGIAREQKFTEAYRAHQARIFTGTAAVAALAILVAALYLIYGGDIFTIQTLRQLNREDGILETSSAALLLGASGLALWVALRADQSAVKAMHFFLAFLFFAMCGEEISWGQRLLNFETPEALREVNVQQEINLHNMFGYLFDHLFILCFFIWGCVVPYLYWRSAIWRWFQSSIGLPMPSIGLAIAMLVVTLTQDQLTEGILGWSVPGLRVPEVREFLSTLCFVLMMLESRYLVLSPETSERRLDRGVPAE